MSYTEIGRIRPVYRGVWSESTAYTALEMVLSPDGYASYTAKKAVPAGTPLTNTEYWGAMVDVREGLEGKANALVQELQGQGHMSVWPDGGSLIRVVTDGTEVMRTGKNMLPAPAPGDHALGGLTATVNDDGSIALNGTATLAASGLAHLYLLGASGAPAAFPAGTYTLSGCPLGGGAYTYRLYATIYDAEGNVSGYKSDQGETIALTIPEPYGGLIIRLTVGGLIGTVENLLFYPLLEHGSAATHYEPYQGGAFDVVDGAVSIPALSGENVLYTNGEYMELKYNKSIAKALEDALARIAALEAAAAATE